MDPGDVMGIVRDYRERLGAGADALNEKLLRCESVLRGRGFMREASVPLSVRSDRSTGPEMVPGGQLAWLESDDGWGLMHLDPELGVRPLLATGLKCRVAAAMALEALVYEMVLSEDA